MPDPFARYQTNLEHFYLFGHVWIIFTSYELFWTIWHYLKRLNFFFIHFGPFLTIQDHLGLFWRPVYARPIWMKLQRTHFEHFRPFLTILDTFRPFYTMFDHFQTCLTILDSFGPFIPKTNLTPPSPLVFLNFCHFWLIKHQLIFDKVYFFFLAKEIICPES